MIITSSTPNHHRYKVSRLTAVNTETREFIRKNHDGEDEKGVADRIIYLPPGKAKRERIDG